MFLARLVSVFYWINFKSILRGFEYFCKFWFVWHVKLPCSSSQSPVRHWLFQRFFCGKSKRRKEILSAQKKLVFIEEWRNVLVVGHSLITKNIKILFLSSSYCTSLCKERRKLWKNHLNIMNDANENGEWEIFLGKHRKVVCDEARLPLQLPRSKKKLPFLVNSHHVQNEIFFREFLCNF